MIVKFKARPNLNGNSAQDFDKAYTAFNAVYDALEAATTAALVNVLHGRNYQHLSLDEAIPAREQDIRDLRMQRDHIASAIQTILDAIEDASDL